MIDNLILFSIKNKLIIGFFVLALVGWGVYSFTRLPIDAVPDITNNQVQVITQTPSLAAEEVERFITAPLELALVNLPDVVELRSISRLGLSVITVVFREEADVYTCRQLVSENIQKAAADIPAGMGKPQLTPITTGLGEIYQYIIQPKKGFENQYSPTDLRTIQDWIVKRQLAGTEGIVEISSYGGFQKQYEIAINPDRLRAMNLTLEAVFQALANNNANTGGSYIEKNRQAFFVRGEGLAGSLADLEKIVIANRRNTPVLVRDVATVRFGHAVRYGAMTEDGKGEVVGGIVMMLRGANSAQVISEVKKRVERINKNLPEGLEIQAFLDRTKLVNTAISTVTENLVIGGLIVIFVLVLLMGNLRAGLVVASVIPLSLLFAISLMNVFGISANLMSLGAIDFGLIVDGAVIIVESIIFHIQSPPTPLKGGSLTENGGNTLSGSQSFDPPFRGAGGLDAIVFSATSKIRHSAAFGEIIILMVYLPILALTGVEGKMFRPMAQTVGFAIFGALILSMTYVPMASALFLKPSLSYKKTFADKFLHFLHKGYDPLIRKALKNRILVVILSVLLFAGSLLVFLQLGGEFIPTLDEGDFAIDTGLMTGSSLTEMVDATLQAEKILLKEFPDEVIKVVGKIGNSEVPTDPMPIEAADLMVVLKEKKFWKKASARDELAAQMAEKLAVLPGVTFDFQQPIQMRFNELMTGVKSDVAVKVYGENLQILIQQAAKVAAVVRKIEGVADVKVERTSGLQQMVVRYDRAKLAQYGVNIADLNRLLRTAFAGETAGVIFEGEKRFDLVIRLDSLHRTGISDLQNLNLNLPNGNPVSLSELADITFQEAPAQISRDNAKRRITIGINVRGRDVESLVNEIQQKLEAEVRLPVGYYFTFGGQFENLQAAKQRLSIAVPVALLLIFMLLYFTFHSFKQTLLVFTAIPLAAIGGVLALWLRGMPFSISAGVGFIALFGVAVLNGIVLVSYLNDLKKEGITDIHERILRAVQVRFRPVLMTAFVASLGFLPMALSSAAGAEVQKPLATVVMGGLLTATLLTLVVLPVLYSLFFQDKKTDSQPIENEEVEQRKEPDFILKSTLGILLLSFCLSANAQNMTWQQAVQNAFQNNPGLKIAGFETQQQQLLRRTAYDIPRTNFDLQYGQIQAQPQDYTFNLSQSVAFPSLYIAQKRLANSNIRVYEQRFAVQKNELAKQVKESYFQILNLQDLLELLQRQDSVYKNLAKAATVRYKTGETNRLEEVSAQARSQQVLNRIRHVEAEQAGQYKNLQRLLSTNESVSIVPQKRLKKEFSLPADSLLYARNPLLALLRSQQEAAGRLTDVEKKRLLPDFRFGYFNQSIQEVKNFQGISAGVSVPLFFGSQQARIQAATVGNRIASQTLSFQQKQLQTQAEILTLQYQRLIQSLAYYETFALPQAEAILRTAATGFRLGEVDYTAYALSTLQAWQIQEDYLTELFTYNLLIINLEFLAGTE
jgi:heavy metal efflux system protein